MSSIVIVTSRCYLLCEAINYISMDVCGRDNDDKDYLEEDPKNLLARIRNFVIRKRNSSPTAQPTEEPYFQITINFIPANSGGNNNSISKHGNDQRQVQILVQGEVKAEAVFKEMISQIREQIPDQMFLNSLVEKLLNGDNTQGEKQ